MRVGRSVIVSAAVLVPAEVAAELARFADAGRDRVRQRDGYRMSGPCEQALAELKAMARAARVRLATTSVESDRPGTMSTSEYVERHGGTPQNVTEKCRRGTLPAELVNGKWRIYEKEDST